jgi:hypothetical protein
MILYILKELVLLDTFGSLRLTIVLNGLGDAVKLSFAFALEGQSPFGIRKPFHASVTFWKANDS